jgi:chromosome partitioning protein
MASGPGLGWPVQPAGPDPGTRQRPAGVPPGSQAPMPGPAPAAGGVVLAGLGWPAGRDGPAGAVLAGRRGDGARHGAAPSAAPAEPVPPRPAQPRQQALPPVVSRETGVDGNPPGTARTREGDTGMTENAAPGGAGRTGPGGGPALPGTVARPAAVPGQGSAQGGGHGRTDADAGRVLPASGQPTADTPIARAADTPIARAADTPIARAADTPIARAADTPIARAAQAALVARAGGPAWPRPAACRIITIANQKGGVGKTTSAVNLAVSLALHGCRVLVVDLDPQGNASTALDVDHHTGIPSVYNVLVDDRPLTAIVRPVGGIPNLHCAPATIDLAGAEIELVPLVARESRLMRALSGYSTSELDYILIDCPPSLGLLTVNALVAAPEVLIPIQCEYYALEGLEQLLRTVNLVKSHLNPALTVSTILLTMYDARTRLASQVADEVRQHFGDIVLESVIPRSVRVSEAPSYGQSVMTYDPGSSGAVAYLDAAREMAYRSTPIPG